jgi:hypothetical protein
VLKLIPTFEETLKLEIMKHFIYFESTDGGMDSHKHEFKDNNIKFNLYGWMNENYGCDTSDKELIEWAKKCEIGDYFEHRLGTCVRVNNN